MNAKRGRLLASEVREIRASSLLVTKLAERFKTSVDVINDVRQYRSYAYIRDAALPADGKSNGAALTHKQASDLQYGAALGVLEAFIYGRLSHAQAV